MIFVVDVHDACVNDLSDRQHFRGVRDSLHRDAGNMDQAVHAVNDLRKRAVGLEPDDLDRCHVANGVLRFENVPGIVRLGLIAERNTLLFGVVALHKYRDLIPNRNDLGRVADVLPGKLRDMNHAVHARTEIHKRAVRREIADGALVGLSDLDPRPEFRFHRALFLALYLTDGTDRFLALLLDFDDAETNRGADQFIQIAVFRNARLRRGNEHAARIGVNHDAAFHRFGDLAFQHGLFLASRNDVLPVSVGVNALFGKLRNALDVADTDDERFDLVTLFESFGQLQRRIVGNLIRFDVPCNAGSQVELQFSIRHIRNGSGNDVSYI